MEGQSILIVDFGGVYTLPVANKLRGERVYCEILPPNAQRSDIFRINPKGVVLVGGAEDAFSPESAAIPEAVFELNVPILGIGYGARALAKRLGAQLIESMQDKHTGRITFEKSPLFDEMVLIERYFERIDLMEYPEDVEIIARNEEGMAVAFSSEQRIYGMQFYPERNDPDGIKILNNFARRICECEPWWKMEAYIDLKTAEIREQIGEGEAILAVSGGIDSTVAALLMNRAIGKRVHCLHIDTGLLRKGETKLMQEVFSGMFGMDVIHVDASERVIRRLKGISDPQHKHEIITEELVSSFVEAASAIPNVNCLVQGTIYPDILSSDEPELIAVRTREKLEEKMNIVKLIEPVSSLFKYEVRKVGELLGLPPELVNRQPFPITGLALRCVSEVTEYKLRLLREADAIYHEEIARADLEKRIWQWFVVLTDFRSKNIRDDSGEYEYAVALRAMNHGGDGAATSFRLPYELLERVVSRITSEVPGINRVLYDLTGRPPAPIEWE